MRKQYRYRSLVHHLKYVFLPCVYSRDFMSSIFGILPAMVNCALKQHEFRVIHGKHVLVLVLLVLTGTWPEPDKCSLTACFLTWNRCPWKSTLSQMLSSQIPVDSNDLWAKCFEDCFYTQRTCDSCPFHLIMLSRIPIFFVFTFGSHRRCS